ncbi:MAG TPA: hypothetical protein VHA74_02080 [Candidatus Dojkabacteria bacterium]|nr:hypothetical protein [Candidatus Dojkabacteria bacterium]
MLHIWERVKKFNENKVLTTIIICIVILLVSLSFMRNSIKDENLYLRETMILSEVIKSGHWFGNYAVGLHGSLFKLPVALIFIFTGPNVAIATIFNLILAISSAYIFYRILKNFLKFNGWALAGVLLFVTGFEFVRNAPTYLRDIPVLFSFLIFIYFFLKKSNKWLLGLLLLLVLDAKEHVFYMIAPAYLAYLFIESFWGDNTSFREGFWNKLKDFVINLVISFAPASIYLLLMFYTGIVPVNMFDASILGLIEKGLGWNQKQFSIDMATANLIADEATKNIYQIPIDSILPNIPSFLRGVTDIVLVSINIILRYFGKILYPRSFSFISIPKLIIFPALAMSALYIRTWWRNVKKNLTMIGLVLILWSYVGIFILRASQGRYLLAITPIVIIFFILFLKEGFKYKKFALWTIILSIILSYAGMFFELTFIWVKLLFITILGVLFLALYWIHKHNSKYSEVVTFVLICVVSIITLGTSLAFSIKLGQISEFMRWGYNHQANKIFENVPENEKIFINDIGWDQYPKIVRKDLSLYPQWHWDLKKGLPKVDQLVYLNTPNTYLFTFASTQEMKSYIGENDIKQVFIVKSDIKEIKFDLQGFIPELEKSNWLKLDRIVYTKNAQTYIFDVK